MGVEIQWKWATTSDLSKLLGTLFGLHMDLHNVDQPFVDKVKSKLKCWSSTHLSLICRTFIVNHMLMSYLWYFTTVWVGFKRFLVNIKALLHNYLWCGSKNTTRSWLSWDKCMIPKKIGGLSVTSSEDAIKALISKWIIQAVMPDHANMQILVRCRITWLQPCYHDKWGPTSLWLFSLNFSNRGGSQVWRHITHSWKVVARKVVFLSPFCLEDM